MRRIGSWLRAMNVDYPYDRDGLCALLADLAAPWWEPAVGAGFGSSFQRALASLPDDADAFVEIDRALRAWVGRADPATLLALLADIEREPPSDGAVADLRGRRRDAWDDAVYWVLTCLAQIHAESFTRRIDLPQHLRLKQLNSRYDAD